MNQIATIQNQTAVSNSEKGLIEIEQSRAVAEIQAACVMARKMPRDENFALAKIKKACQRLTLAEQAIYSYPKGGQQVEGPSIRLAETILQCWGNLRAGVKELEQRNGESTVEVFAWDMESNTYDSKTFQIKHWRDTKQGGYLLKDSRDIYELVANQAARRKRACILAMIPSDIVEAAVLACEETLKANEREVTPEKITSLIVKFSEVGVTKDQLEKRVMKKIEVITTEELRALGKIYNSLKDGMSKIADWFQTPTIEEAVNKHIQQTVEGTEKEPETDWQNWLENLLASVAMLKTVVELDAWLASNKEALNELPKAPREIQRAWITEVGSFRSKLEKQ